jgi:hypothetical protein
MVDFAVKERLSAAIVRDEAMAKARSSSEEVFRH